MSMSITPTEKTQEILSQAKDLAMEMKNTQVRKAWVGGWDGGDGGTEGGRCGLGRRKVDLLRWPRHIWCAPSLVTGRATSREVGSPC